MQRCIFSIITPVFSVTWSSEIILICWFAAQQTFLIIINVQNSCEQHLFEIEIFCNIINVFTVTFDQFNASVDNSIYLLKSWCTECMHVYICICIYIYIHTYIHIYIHTYIHIYIHTHFFLLARPTTIRAYKKSTYCMQYAIYWNPINSVILNIWTSFVSQQLHPLSLWHHETQNIWRQCNYAVNTLKEPMRRAKAFKAQQVLHE